MIIQYEKTFQGAHKFYAFTKNGLSLNRQYFFYTKREALKRFKNELKELNGGN
jgi:hypothetical protein